MWDWLGRRRTAKEDIDAVTVIISNSNVSISHQFVSVRH